MYIRMRRYTHSTRVPAAAPGNRPRGRGVPLEAALCAMPKPRKVAGEVSMIKTTLLLPEEFGDARRCMHPKSIATRERLELVLKRAKRGR